MKKHKNSKWIIGIDEVGRGSLAGPVTVGAALVKSNLKPAFGTGKPKLLKVGMSLKDSKKLSEKQREKWFSWIRKEQRGGRLFYATASVSPRVIDRINISNAANIAAERVILKVIRKSNVPGTRIKRVYLDGGLYPKSGTDRYKLKTVVRADEKIPAVSLASIAAKVTRDKYMRKLHKRYAKYGFETNKGYGTGKHILAVRKRGFCSHHRLTFVGKYINIRKYEV